jgi:hypothetical protein
MKRARIVVLSVVLVVATLGVGLLAAHTIAAASPSAPKVVMIDFPDMPPHYLIVAVGDAQSLQRYLQAELPICAAGKCYGSSGFGGMIPGTYAELEKYPAPFCYLKADIELRTALLDATEFTGYSKPAAAVAVVKDGLHEVALALQDYYSIRC